MPRPPDTADATAPTTLGDWYEVVGQVGQGAAARVFEVRDTRTGALRAAKVLRRESVENPDIVRRFEDEFRTLHRLNHPSLPAVYDYGWLPDDTRFMVMDLVSGQRLDEYLREHPDDLWVVLYELSEALTFIHSHDLLHLDIKPENILVRKTRAFGDEMPLVTLIDFGLAYWRDRGDAVSLVGTAEYMAPEIIRGETPLTRAVDYYSLGITLYELVEGHVPFSGDGREVFAAHLDRGVSFSRERLEYTELYPHVRGLTAKQQRTRLESFEELRRTIAGRLTGGIEELDRVYGLAYINSLGMIGKDEVWKELMEWLEGVVIWGTPTTDRDTPQSVGFDLPNAVARIQGEEGGGRTYLVEQLSVEASIRGWRSVLLRSDGDHGCPLPHLDPSGSCEDDRPALVVCDEFFDLEESTQSAFTQLWNAVMAEFAAGRPIPIAFIFVGRPPATSGFSVEGAIGSTFTIRPLPSCVVEEVVARFRGRMNTRADVVRLERMVSRISQRSDVLTAGLSAAVVRGTLAYSRAVWRVGAEEIDYEVGTGSFYSALVATFPKHAQTLLMAVACHNDDAGLSMLASVTGLPRQELASAAEIGSAHHLVRTRVGSDDTFIGLVNDAIRRELRAIVPPLDRKKVHEEFVDILTGTAARAVVRPPDLQSLFFHLRALRRPRDAAVVHLRLARLWYKLSDTSELRRVLEEGLHFLESEWVRSEGWSCGLKRYYLKLGSHKLLPGNRYSELYELYNQAYPEEQGEVPVAIAAPYCNALIRMKLLEKAEHIITSSESRVRRGAQVWIDLVLEKSLLETHRMQYERSLRELSRIVDVGGVNTPRQQSRVMLYRAMNLESLGHQEESIEILDAVEPHARRHDLADELCLAALLRANIMLSRSQLREAIGLVSRALRVATRAKLPHRVSKLYFMASAMYFEQGFYARAQRYLERALRIALNARLFGDAAMYTLRLSMISQSSGLYGNALRFAQKAIEMSDSSMSHESSAMARVVLVELRVIVGLVSEYRQAYALFPDIDDGSSPDIAGYREYVLGELYSVNQPRCAIEHYRRARQLYEVAGYDDDATRSALREATIHVESGNLTGATACEKYAEDALKQMESVTLSTELSSVMLKRAVAAQDRETARNIMLTRMSPVDSRVEHLTRVNAERELFDAASYLGEQEVARAAFSRYYELVKFSAANIEDPQMTDGFLARVRASESISKFRRLRDGE